MNRYFLDRLGAVTRRMRGAPGQPHLDIAREILGNAVPPGDDLYERMFELGYVRVVETDTEVLVDAPRALTRAQEVFLDRKRSAGKLVVVNRPAFVATRNAAGDGAVA